MSVTEELRCMGCAMRLTASAPGVAKVRRLLHDLDATLTRFDPASELERLNADPRPTVAASPMLRAGVRAALWSARRSDGLCDPTLHGAVRAAGYTTSRAGRAPADLRAALARAPLRHPAAAHPARRWARVAVDERRGTITRPPGLALDLGGSAKGLAADLAALVLDGEPAYVIDCAGDLRVRSRAGTTDVVVEHPLTGDPATILPVRSAVATSGIGRRLWTDAGGRPAHHLIDPARGVPAWTGLVSATATATTALAAETLARQALLAGPTAARALLRGHGGVLVDDRGAVEVLGPLVAVAA